LLHFEGLGCGDPVDHGESYCPSPMDLKRYRIFTALFF
jgi:hypothetical protein